SGRAPRASRSTRAGGRFSRTACCPSRRRNTSAAGLSAAATAPRPHPPENSMRPDLGFGRVADALRDAVGGLLHQRAPLRLHAVGRRGERERGDEAPGVVADAGGDAAHADLGFLAVGGEALALDALEVALE